MSRPKLIVAVIATIFSPILGAMLYKANYGMVVALGGISSETASGFCGTMAVLTTGATIIVAWIGWLDSDGGTL